VAVIVTAVMAALAVAGVVIAIGSAAQGHGGVPWVEVTLGAVILLYVAVGAVITSARPGHRIGWLLLGGALTWAIGEAALASAIYGLLERPGSIPGASLLAVGGTTLRGLGWWLLVVLLPLVFPTGRLAARRWRWVYPLAAVGVVGYLAVSLLSPWPADDRLTGVDNPIGLPQRWAAVIGGLGVATILLFTAAVAAGVASLVWRWRHGDGLVRQQLLWFTAAAMAPLAVLVAMLAGSAPPVTFAVAVAPVPIVVGLAVLQHRLYDIHLAVNRTLVYLTLSAAVVAMYLLVVAGVGALLDTAGAPWLSWLAAGVVAVSFAPLRQALQRAVNRLTYGRWDDPYGVLSGLARHLQVAADVPALIQQVVDGLAGALHLPYVQVTDAQGRLLAACGRPGPAPQSWGCRCRHMGRRWG
jgi:hypothetical protein